jgi:hypothetical protein
VAVAETALARPPTGLSGGERHQLVVFVDAETLATDSPGASATGGGHCAVADGPGIAPETARRLSCDCSYLAILRDRASGELLDVGRRTRSIPPPMRRALSVRDEHCRFPGCERRHYVDGHHIVPWSQGGETKLDNLVLLCRHHHRLVHEGGFSVGWETDAAAGKLRWRRPDGRSVDDPPSPRPKLPPLDWGAPGPLHTGTGESMDLASCVDAVLAATN